MDHGVLLEILACYPHDRLALVERRARSPYTYRNMESKGVVLLDVSKRGFLIQVRKKTLAHQW